MGRGSVVDFDMSEKEVYFVSLANKYNASDQRYFCAAMECAGTVATTYDFMSTNHSN